MRVHIESNDTATAPVVAVRHKQIAELFVVQLYHRHIDARGMCFTGGETRCTKICAGVCVLSVGRAQILKSKSGKNSVFP